MSFLPFTRPGIDEETIAAVGEVLRSGWITSGPRVKEFEDRLAEYCGGRTVRTFNSGTATMEVGLRLAGIGPGDEVLLPSFTIISCVTQIVRCGGVPVLVDSLGQALNQGEHLNERPDLAVENKERLLMVAGLVRSSLEQVDQNGQTVFRRNDSVKTGLKTLNDAMDDAIPIFIWNYEQKVLAGQQGVSVPQQFLVAAGDKAIVTTLALYRAELVSIEKLLDARIALSLRNRNMVSGFTIGILLLVCYLFLAFDISVRK